LCAHFEVAANVGFLGKFSSVFQAAFLGRQAATTF